MKEWNSNRRFGMEILEDRALLAVSAGFAQLGFPAETAPTGTAVWVVNTAADSTGWNEMDDVISLREAISCSSAGDTIIFDPGLAGQTITLSGLGLFVVNVVTIDSSGIGGITVTAGGRSQVFYIDLEPDDRAVGLIGLTITGGNADDGGGIYNCGALTMTDCTVSGNTSGSRGGAIFSEGVLTLTDCTVSGNTASYSGGGIESHGSLTLSGCVIAGNSANDYWSYDESGSGSESLSTGRGGGIYSEGVLRLTGCTVSENTASEGGGIYSVSATLADCVITGNSAAGYIYSYSEGGSYFYAYGYGGGVYVGGELTAASCVISGNSTGGVRREADSSSIFSSGGGIYNEGVLTLTNSVVSAMGAVHRNMKLSPTPVMAA